MNKHDLKREIEILKYDLEQMTEKYNFIDSEYERLKKAYRQSEGLNKQLNKEIIGKLSIDKNYLINFLMFCRDNGQTWILKHEIEALIDKYFNR